MNTHDSNGMPTVDSFAQLQAKEDELGQFFTDIRRKMEQKSQFEDLNEAASCGMPSPNRPAIDQFFADINCRIIEKRTRDRSDATGFNIFDWIDPNENKLSDIIAGLLNPHGGHGQGDTFLRLLLGSLNFNEDCVDTRDAFVEREAPTHGIEKDRRRMDILICAGALVAIENKIDSLEQQDQVNDYLDHLEYRGRHDEAPHTLIYLTPDGRAPDNLAPALVKKFEECGKLCRWSYKGELRRWLKECITACEANRVCHFLSDFIAYIDSNFHRVFTIQQKEENYGG